MIKPFYLILLWTVIPVIGIYLSSCGGVDTYNYGLPCPKSINFSEYNKEKLAFLTPLEHNDLIEKIKICKQCPNTVCLLPLSNNKATS